MNSHSLRRLVPAAVAAAAVIGGLAAAAAPASAAPPPFENGSNTSEVGTLTFYNASGAVITNGSSTTAPFAAYAVGSVSPRSSDRQAELLFANPDPNSDPSLWFKNAPGSYTEYPLTTGPSNVQTLSQTRPVVTGDSGDQPPSAFLSGAKTSSVAGYTNVIQVRLRSADTFGQAAGTYDVADIQLDPGAGTWTQIFPSTTVTAPAAPSNVKATAGNGTATVSWTAPTNNGGGAITGYDLQESLNGGTTYTKVAHAGTSTSQVVAVTNGQTYTFRVAAINAAGESAFAESGAVKPVADASSLTMKGGKTVKYGSSATLTGVLTDSVTKKALAGQTVTLQQHSATATVFANYKTVKASSTGAVSYSVKPSAKTFYRWSYAGISSHKAVTSSSATVLVTPAISTAVNHTSVKHGASVSVYGVVSPAVTGQRVYLQQLVGKVYKTTKITATVKRQKLPNGKTLTGYLLNVKVSAKGSFTYRVYVPATSIRTSVFSGALHVKAS